MSIYKTFTKDELDNVFSQFLINSWGYSKVTSFARNEKAFEMVYIYGYNTKSSATTIAGQAYHACLDSYFTALQESKVLDLVALEQIAFEFIENIPGNAWKIQKTTPDIESCVKKALTTTSSLLKNFLSETSIYLEEVEEVLNVEVFCNEFLTINGVDIPLPCRAKIDLVVKLKSGKVAIIDHKSKNAFSSEEDLAFGIGIQAITYINCYESKTSLCVDEVWFIENKYSQNRDKTQKQLSKFKIILDDDNRRLYEALLYEPLKRMITAVNDPDYIYLINDSDNFVDKAQIYDFWAKTMIAEIEEFNVPEDKKELLAKRQKKIRDASIGNINPKVIRQFKQNASEFIQYDLSNKNMTEEEKIEHVLRSFGTIVKVSHKFDGYSSNTYLLEVSAGVKISSIQNHRLDLANALNVSTVRISKELVIYENKAYLSIEFSKKRTRDLFFDPKELTGMKIPLGKDNLNNTIIWDHDNHSTPHALICGGTGSGKSVQIKTIIEYAKLAKITKIVIFDPKYEFTSYSPDIKIKVHNDILDIEKAMKKLVDDMNYLVKNNQKQKTLIVFDEFADAVSASRKGAQLDIKEMVCVGVSAKGVPKMKLQKVGEEKSLEENLKIILQKGRSIGFRVLAATQRASVKVISGDAKVNFPVQICFKVRSETDSRVVLDEAGGESLAGYGDGLIKSPEYPETTRYQAFYKN